MVNKNLTIALAGNPNSGKTTIFNHLTGSRQHVGNYPGVTVEKKEGVCKFNGQELRIVDLPGTYSLTAYSIEEIAARNFIIDEKPDVIVDILDAGNIERNLYLATQLMELNVPLVLVLNMSDTAKARGIVFDLERLSQLLGAPIIPTIGHKGEGIQEVIQTAINVSLNPKQRSPLIEITFGSEIEEEIQKIKEKLNPSYPMIEKYGSRWIAVKLLENDNEIIHAINDDSVQDQVQKSTERITHVLGDNPEIMMADHRYGIISGACQEAIKNTVEARHTLSDKIDEFLAHSVLGLPIFFTVMYLVFQFTFRLGEYPMAWLENGFIYLGQTISQLWPKQADSLLRSMLVDGIIGGVGGILSFIPNIFFLFLAISFLEDSGYMARAAFNMDRWMHKIGLHGKSFIPMLLGFGCSIPAIMATRTLDNQRDRLTTMLVVPLMSCGARFPIYALIIPAFFPQTWQAPILLIIYATGILLAIIGAKVLRSTLLKGDNTPMVMELPPYRLPTLRGISQHVWERTYMYIKKAGTVILGFSIVLWVLSTFPQKDGLKNKYEQKSAQIRTEFLQKTKQYNTQIGLPEGSNLLTQAIQAEWQMNEKQTHYFPSNPMYEQVQQKKEQTIKNLIQTQHGEKLADFLKVRDTIVKIQNEFIKEVNRTNLQENGAEYSLLEREKDIQLRELKNKYPQIYPAAMQYLNEIKKPYQSQLQELDQSMSAEKISYTIAGRIGKGLEPLLQPLGFDWRIGTALIGALAAKEIFVAQLGIVYSLGEVTEDSQALRQELQKHYTPLIGFCIMIFCLISAPCMATIAATRLESQSWKWALFQLTSLTAVAYVLTFTIYQVGRLLGIGT